MTEPQYETPTITEVLDIIDLLRPWMHGFTLIKGPHDDDLVVCDCGWTSSFGGGDAYDLILEYRRHVGYEE